MNDAIANDKRAGNVAPEDETQQLAPQENAATNADENAIEQKNETVNELENAPGNAPERDTAPKPSDELDDCVTGISSVADDDADDELSALFSSFADVRASDALKTSTLDRLSALISEADAESQADDERLAAHVAISDTDGSEANDADDTTTQQLGSALASGEGGADASVEAPSPETTAEGTAAITATATQAIGETTSNRNPKKRSGFKARFRAIRVAAVAACLALALVGGVAYATPTSHVQLSQGDASIDLAINWFGLVISASSEDETGQAAIKESRLLNAPYDEALERAADAMGKARPDYPLEASVNSDDSAQRERLENRNREFLSERNREWHSNNAPEGSPEAGQAGRSPEGAPNDRRPNDTAPTGEPAGAANRPDEGGQGQDWPTGGDQQAGASQPDAPQEETQPGNASQPDAPQENMQPGETGYEGNQPNQPATNMEDEQPNGNPSGNAQASEQPQDNQSSAEREGASPSKSR